MNSGSSIISEQELHELKINAEKGVVDAQIKLADFYLEVNQRETAISWLKRAADPKDCADRLISSPHNKEKYDNDIPRGDLTAQRKLGYLYLEDRNYQEALKWFSGDSKASIENPRYGGFNPIYVVSSERKRVYVERGICHFYLSKFDLAIECFRKSDDDCFGLLWLSYTIFKRNEAWKNSIEPDEVIHINIGQKQPKFKITSKQRNFISSNLDNIRDSFTYKDDINKLMLRAAESAAAEFIFRPNSLDMTPLEDRIFKKTFTENIIDFLVNLDKGPSYIILTFYYEFKCNQESKLASLEMACKRGDSLAYLIKGRMYKDKKNFAEAKKLFDAASEGIDYPEKIKIRMQYESQHELRSIDLLTEIEGLNLQIRLSEKELEQTMSMFAHKFRSPLDAILYNTNHEHQPKLYIQAAQTMQGLLDIFSTIATDAEHLQARLAQDNQGNGNLMNVLTKTLDLILLHLLSVSASEKIQQHYVRYAKAQGLCPNEISDKQWNEDYFELEQQLQAEWEHSFAQLLNQSPTIQQRLAWLEPRFFKLEVQGFESSTIQFRDYGITESFLTILLNEILVNAFKYYASDEQQAVVLAWTEQTGHQVLSCRNPCTDKERSKLKGSGKGHTFLSALARKSGSQFAKPKVNDEFVLEFGIANQLLMSS